MAANRTKKKAAATKKTTTKETPKPTPKAAKAQAKPAKAKPAKAKPAPKPAKAKPNAPPAPAVVKKPKKPAKANKAPATPHRKTIFTPEKKVPPKPKATITRAKAIALANVFLKENLGKGALYTPRASRFRLGSIVDRGGVINVLFCHEGNEADPAIVGLGAKCAEALVAAHPQLLAFELDVQTIRM